MELKKFLDSNNLSHADFAKQVGVSQVAVHHWVHGRSRPGVKNMARITEVTGSMVTAKDIQASAEKKLA